MPFAADEQGHDWIDPENQTLVRHAAETIEQHKAARQERLRSTRELRDSIDHVRRVVREARKTAEEGRQIVREARRTTEEAERRYHRIYRR
jgi:methyl-accepting chemotaxis protein